MERGEYGPKWEIHVSEVPRLHRHAVRTLLANEGLPRIREWFQSLASVPGYVRSSAIELVFDETQQTLEVKYSEW